MECSGDDTEDMFLQNLVQGGVSSANADSLQFINDATDSFITSAGEIYTFENDCKNDSVIQTNIAAIVKMFVIDNKKCWEKNFFRQFQFNEVRNICLSVLSFRIDQAQDFICGLITVTAVCSSSLKTKPNVHDQSLCKYTLLVSMFVKRCFA